MSSHETKYTKQNNPLRLNTRTKGVFPPIRLSYCLVHYYLRFRRGGGVRGDEKLHCHCYGEREKNEKGVENGLSLTLTT